MRDYLFTLSELKEKWKELSGYDPHIIVNGERYELITDEEESNDFWEKQAIPMLKKRAIDNILKGKIMIEKRVIERLTKTRKEFNDLLKILCNMTFHGKDNGELLFISGAVLYNQEEFRDLTIKRDNLKSIIDCLESILNEQSV